MSNPNPAGIPPGTDQIQQAIDTIVKPSGTFPLEVDLGTGEIFKGATPEDLLNKLVAAKAEATRTIRSRDAELADLRTRQADLEARIPPPAVDPSQAKDNAYYEMWAKDPDEAARMQLSKMLDIPKDQVVDVLKSIVRDGVTTKAADEFVMRHPDFPQSPQSAGIMTDMLARRFGQTINSTTADNLELVYHQAIREGRLQPQQLQTQGIHNPNPVMPNLRGGSAPPNPANEIMSAAQTMKLEDLKAVIDRLSTQGQR